MTAGRGVLAPAVAGTWYPARRDELAGAVDRLLDDAGARATPASGRAWAVVAPHAGYAYSGPVAASALRSLAGAAPRRVVLLGPSHHFGFAGAAIPEAAVAQRTPLGDLPLDREALGVLAESTGVRRDDEVFAPEHALEVEVPFLQRLFDPAPMLVPVLFGGRATLEEARGVARALLPLVDDRTVVVASSDFTHYGPRFGYVPFVSDVPARLRALDLEAAGTIAAARGDAFARLVAATGATICGRRAIDALLALLDAKPPGAVLEYDTSGRIAGDWSHSVSYASIAFPA